MYKEIFKDTKYPSLLDTIDILEISELPPWNFIKEKYDFWKDGFNKVNLFEYAPFARMINDDVIATFNIKIQSDEIYLFLLPIFSSSVPFKKLENINAWLTLALEDCHQYLIEF